jgi:hypothetical protein
VVRAATAALAVATVLATVGSRMVGLAQVAVAVAEESIAGRRPVASLGSEDGGWGQAGL